MPPTLEIGWVAPASRSCQLDAHRKRDGQSNRSTLFEKGTITTTHYDIGTYGKRVTSRIGTPVEIDYNHSYYY